MRQEQESSGVSQAPQAVSGMPVLPCPLTQPAEWLDHALRLAQRGRYLDLQPWLPALESSGVVTAQALAGRVRGHLGGHRAASARALALWRRHRQDGEAMTEMLRTVLHRRGVYRAWKLMRSLSLSPSASPAVAADWHSLCAYILGSVRDFHQAEAAFARALAADPDAPWIHVEWSYVCEQRDRYDDAIAHAERSLALRPGYRPGVQALSHLCTLVGRDDEALALLSQAAEHMQSSSVCTQLVDLQIERREYEHAWEMLDRVERFSPLADKDLTAWLNMRRADVALALGHRDKAQLLARRAGGPYHERLADRLQEGTTEARRVELPVGFVRQHHLTCAPATLATLSRYWGRTDVHHLEIAEQICYDGTPNHSERRWAEEQGFMAREFTVDWASATALLDAGVPFTLTTIYTASAHLQAVIGYDALRRSLLVRDPAKRTYNEFEADALFESHRSNGPRGMLLLPPDQARRIEGIALPDAALWDSYHQMMLALSQHRRDDAQGALRALFSRDPSHRLTLQARRGLMSYDGDRAGELAITQQLGALFPGDINLQLGQASLLSIVGSRAQQEAWWQTFATGPDADPVAMTRYAEFLSDDGRQHAAAQRLCERALARHPFHAGAWHSLAGVIWQQGDRRHAQQLYRVAACLGETQEHLAASYFRTCRFLGDSEAGLAFLVHRVETLGSRSSGPVMTLFNQLDDMDRTAEAFDRLQTGLDRRPGDADLLLYSAEANMRYGRHAQALSLLTRAEPLCARGAWLQRKSRWLRENGEPVVALALAREASVLEPLDVGLHALVASLLTQSEGRPAGLAHLRQAAASHPHHQELQRIYINWLGPEESDEAIAVLGHLLEVNPQHVWAQRELALKLAQQRRYDEAWVPAQAALALAPHQTATHATLGDLCWRQGRLDDARAHLREAIVLSVDNDYAIEALVNIETSLEGRRQALAFVRAELLNQVTLGDGLLTFQETALHVMEPAEMLGLLESMQAARPDLWQAWAARGLQLLNKGEHAAAIVQFDRAIERFPLVPRFYVEKALAQTLLGQRDAARASLAQALAISPAWQRPVRQYVDTVVDEGHGFERALPVLDKALQRLPDDADLHALRAWVHRRMGRNDDALAELRTALSLDPSLRWAWNLFDQISCEAGQPDAARQLAQSLAQSRPGNVAAWLRCAELAADADAALLAIDHALSREPRHEAAFVARLDALQKADRLSELQAALAAAPWPAERLPSAVAVFEARLAWAQGRPQDAIDAVHRLLANDNNNYALWREVADWYDDQNMHADYLSAAEHMVRLAPNHAVAHGYLGHACQKSNRPDEARRHLARAIEIDPAYAFAGLRLADLQLDAQDWAAAGRTLHTLRSHHTTPYVALRELRTAIGQHDEEAAGRALAGVISQRTASDGLTDDALARMTVAGWSDRVLRTVEAVLAQGPCARPAVRFWLDAQGKGWWLPDAFYRNVRRMLARDPSHSLKSDFLGWLGQTRSTWLLRRFMNEHQEALRQDLECWGMVGYAYLSVKQPARVVHHLADWRQRGAPSWALDNLADAYRRLGRDREARDVSEASLQQEPDNADAQLWMAFDATLAGRLEEASQRLATVADASSLRTYYRQLFTGMQAYLDAVQALDSRKALGRFAALAHEGKGHTVLQRMLRTLALRLVREHTPVWARAWRRLQFATGLS